MLCKIAAFSQYFNQFIVKIAGMRSHEADAWNVDLAHIVHEVPECIIQIRKILAVCIHILPQQSHFLKALTGQLPNLGDDILRTAAALLAPRKRYDAVGTELITAVHDIHPGTHPLPFLRQVLYDVAFLGPDFNYKLLAVNRFLNKLRQLYEYCACQRSCQRSHIWT